MSSYHLLLPTLNVTGCNWESSHLTRSLPLTAMAGFVDYLMSFELADNAAEAGANLEGFAICLHGGQIYEGLSKNPLALCKGNGLSQARDDLLNPPLTPEVKGSVSLSLVVALELEDKSALNEWLKNRATAFLQTCRLAGGDIIGIGQPKVYIERSKLAQEIRRLPPGWFIGNGAELISNAPDPFAALLNAVAWFPVKDKEPQTTSAHPSPSRQRPYPGHWLYATCVGYQLLESPQPRRNRSHASSDADSATNHAYAEPVHSLAELVWARNLLRPQDDSTADDWLTENNLLWRWESDAPSRTVYLSTQAL
ncbi:type I-F CRISPR-associated protein Csy2 [Nitrosococcus watsonii]|uniref:CRISPR-associated protein Csy2 n=1 Tax=Nitrosococcus watsoni (strain C-113) TaxID=105559 RepID=D8KBI1_NITWC|nr:type I-F CRISPR-associated protein Csy2 [Nitrosococcus watsonii]ADJ29628.1 CRISPR-associated protein Csy2 [Nitrosococcus watsonii C-113]